jgi:hypothetical protein
MVQKIKSGTKATIRRQFMAAPHEEILRVPLPTMLVDRARGG